MLIVPSPAGERFTNEASPYVTFVHAQIAAGHPYLWFVMDQVARLLEAPAPAAQDDGPGRALPGLPVPEPDRWPQADDHHAETRTR